MRVFDGQNRVSRGIISASALVKVGFTGAGATHHADVQLVLDGQLKKSSIRRWLCARAFDIASRPAVHRAVASVCRTHRA